MLLTPYHSRKAWCPAPRSATWDTLAPWHLHRNTPAWYAPGTCAAARLSPVRHGTACPGCAVAPAAAPWPAAARDAPCYPERGWTSGGLQHCAAGLAQRGAAPQVWQAAARQALLLHKVCRQAR